MPVKAIVFDFDGVLADSEPLHLRVYQDLLEPTGVRLTKETYCERYLGFDDEGVFRQVASDYELMLGDEEIELLIREKAHRFEALAAGGSVLYDGAVACVRRLAARWPLAIASGAMRPEIELILRGGSILDAFRAIVSAQDVENTKPAPDPYLRAAELLGTPPTACAAIEDSHWGLQSARLAGMRTIGITTTYPANALHEANAIVSSLDEITPHLIESLD